MKKVLCFILIAGMLSGLPSPAIAQELANNYFSLSKDIRKDITVDGKYAGRLSFDKDSCLLFVNVGEVNPKKRSLTLSFSIVRKSDSLEVYSDFEPVTIAKVGRPTGKLTNEKKYKEYINARDSLQNEIQNQRAKIDTLSQDPKTPIEALEQLIKDLHIFYEAYQQLKEVLPKPEYVDSYSDVVGLYILNGTLTPAGRVWIKSLPFLKGKVSDTATAPSN